VALEKYEVVDQFQTDFRLFSALVSCLHELSKTSFGANILVE
jgi:hypothetical protein